MISEKLIPAACAFSLELKKPTGTSTYCYAPAEVSAMSAYCTVAGPVRVPLTVGGRRSGITPAQKPDG